jgi:hypothetical protein
VVAWVVWLACAPLVARFLGHLMDWLVPPKIIWPDDPNGGPLDNMPRQTHLRGFVTVLVTVTLLLGLPAFATYALSHYRLVLSSAVGAPVGDAGLQTK